MPLAWEITTAEGAGDPFFSGAGNQSIAVLRALSLCLLIDLRVLFSKVFWKKGKPHFTPSDFTCDYFPTAGYGGLKDTLLILS